MEIAKRHRWHSVHFPSVETKQGWRTPLAGEARGFPDLILVRERLIAVEVKGDGDRLKPEQQDWQDWLLMADVETYVWTPRDYPDEVDRVLRHRGRP